MYSLISVDDEEVTKSKGVNKKIRHKKSVDVLFNKKVIKRNMERIQSKLHNFDGKRYILDDGVKSLAYFHKEIKN